MSAQGQPIIQKSNQKMPGKLYALTGGIGSGKSTVAEMFSARGARIIDADQLARQVVAPDTDGLRAVISQFGKEFLNSAGELERQRLAMLIFSDSSARQKLESILHPLIRQEFLKLWRGRDADLSIPTLYVVPLFYESANSYPEVSAVIVVWAPETLCVERLKARNGLTEEQALERIHAQLAIDKKALKADWVIKNDSTVSALEPQVDKIWKELLG